MIGAVVAVARITSVVAFVTVVISAVLSAPIARASSCSDADAEALSWLEKMSRSHQQVSYHGVVTFQRGEDMQVVQVAHSIHSGHSFERMTRLTGQGAQVTRAGHPLDCVHPGQNLLLGQLQARGCGLAGYYRFQLEEGERIAGRQAIKLLAQPRDMYRYGYIFELDRETGLLLRTSTLGPGDITLERFQFADLTYGEPVSSSVDIDVVHPALHPHPVSPVVRMRRVGLPWSVGWLPRGFTATDAAELDNARRTYTDGLAVFSVFLEPLARAIQPGEGVARVGSTLSYTRGMQLAERPVLVTVIGEVPINTARMVADSVRVVQADD
jgi:sigma-E factor negative regulatory protein RseB